MCLWSTRSGSAVFTKSEINGDNWFFFLRLCFLLDIIAFFIGFWIARIEMYALMTFICSQIKCLSSLDKIRLFFSISHICVHLIKIEKMLCSIAMYVPESIRTRNPLINCIPSLENVTWYGRMWNNSSIILGWSQLCWMRMRLNMLLIDNHLNRLGMAKKIAWFLFLVSLKLSGEWNLRFKQYGINSIWTLNNDDKISN